MASASEVAHRRSRRWLGLCILALFAAAVALGPSFTTPTRTRSGNVVARYAAAADEKANLGGGMTPLMRAAHDGDESQIKQLVEEGAALNQKDDYGWTALRYAVRRNQPEAVRQLLQSGADVNLASESGRTPLMSAVANDLDDMAKILVDSGADISFQNEDGLTAYDLSFRGGSTRDASLRELIKPPTAAAVGDVNKEMDLG
mmetsp:Transcript_38691/g.82300  ORF Transcript_38691/g.82300 Transcript_38691/m.82300 type:complete len:202 (+) Transcript_38691:96-701(+)